MVKIANISQYLNLVSFRYNTTSPYILAGFNITCQTNYCSIQVFIQQPIKSRKQASLIMLCNKNNNIYHNNVGLTNTNVM